MPNASWAFAVGFFVFMLIHELAIESIMVQLPSLPSTVSIWLALFQNLGCVLIPVLFNISGLGSVAAVATEGDTAALLPMGTAESRKATSMTTSMATAHRWLQYIGAWPRSDHVSLTLPTTRPTPQVSPPLCFVRRLSQITRCTMCNIRSRWSLRAPS